MTCLGNEGQELEHELLSGYFCKPGAFQAMTWVWFFFALTVSSVRVSSSWSWSSLPLPWHGVETASVSLRPEIISPDSPEIIIPTFCDAWKLHVIQISTLINKLSLEHRHIPSFLSCPVVAFASTAELKSCQRQHKVEHITLNIFPIWPFKTNLCWPLTLSRGIFMWKRKLKPRARALVRLCDLCMLNHLPKPYYPPG